MKYSDLFEPDGTHSFGTCEKCMGPIEIPGDIYKCPCCGYVESAAWKRYKFKMDKQDELNRRNRKGAVRKKKIT